MDLEKVSKLSNQVAHLTTTLNHDAHNLKEYSQKIHHISLLVKSLPKSMPGMPKDRNQRVPPSKDYGNEFKKFRDSLQNYIKDFTLVQSLLQEINKALK